MTQRAYYFGIITWETDFSLLESRPCSLLSFFRIPPTWFSHLSNLQFSGSQGARPLSQPTSTVLKDGSHTMHRKPKRVRVGMGCLVTIQTYCYVREWKRQKELYVHVIIICQALILEEGPLCYKFFYLMTKCSVVTGNYLNKHQTVILFRVFPMVFSHRQKTL